MRQNKSLRGRGNRDRIRVQSRWQGLQSCFQPPTGSLLEFEHTAGMPLTAIFPMSLFGDLYPSCCSRSCNPNAKVVARETVHVKPRRSKSLSQVINKSGLGEWPASQVLEQSCYRAHLPDTPKNLSTTLPSGSVFDLS